MPSDLPLICQERSRLLREYSEAASRYAISVREMAEFVLFGDEVRASEARRTSRTALEEAGKTRQALYRHEADHTCDRTPVMRNVPDNPLQPPETLPPYPVGTPPTEVPELSSPQAAGPDRPILILENDLSIRTLLGRLLERRGYPYTEIEHVQDLAAELRARAAGLLIIDVSTTEGIEIAIALAHMHPHVKILALAAESIEGRDIPGRFEALPKPFTLDVFMDCVNRLLNRPPAPEPLPKRDSVLSLEPRVAKTTVSLTLFDDTEYVSVRGYKLAARLLVEEVRQNRMDRPSLVYPIVFLYRRHVELMLKRLILKADELEIRFYTRTESRDEDGMKKLARQHSLEWLWDEFRPVVQALRIPHRDRRGINSYIRQLNEIDPKSLASRPQMEKVQEHGGIIGIQTFAEAMEKLAHSLEGFDSYFDDIIEGYHQIANDDRW